MGGGGISSSKFFENLKKKATNANTEQFVAAPCLYCKKSRTNRGSRSSHYEMGDLLRLTIYYHFTKRLGTRNCFGVKTSLVLLERFKHQKSLMFPR